MTINSKENPTKLNCLSYRYWGVL